MAELDLNFIRTCAEIIRHGVDDATDDVRPHWSDGTPAKTRRILYVQNIYKLDPNAFPVMTLRKFNFGGAVRELLWMYRDCSNDVDRLGMKLWDAWKGPDGTIGKTYGYQVGQPYRHHRYKKGDDLDDYPSALVLDDWVWMNQIDAVIYDLRNNPSSRRIMINLWNTQDLAEMNLAPCTYGLQFNVTRGPNGLVLNGVLNQRAQDMLTANGWDVTQHSLLIAMLAQVCGMTPGVFCHSIADCHIYDRHVPIVEDMLNQFIKNADYPGYSNIRSIGELELKSILRACETGAIKMTAAPKLWIDPKIKSFRDFSGDSFRLYDYVYNTNNIKFEVAV